MLVVENGSTETKCSCGCRKCGWKVQLYILKYQLFSVCPVQNTCNRFNKKYHCEINHASRCDSWGALLTYSSHWRTKLTYRSKHSREKIVSNARIHQIAIKCTDSPNSYLISTGRKTRRTCQRWNFGKWHSVEWVVPFVRQEMAHCVKKVKVGP